MTRAAIYARISDDRQGAGLGVARQQHDCEQVADRLGWTVAGVYVDNDLSAYSGKPRPEYLRLVDDVKNGIIDAIVAWHPDRLHRNTRELEDFIDLVEAHATKIATVEAGHYDLSTPAGRMVARQLGAVARYESEHKSARARRKALELAQSGAVKVGGNRPFGYEADRITVREDEAFEIRAAAARVLAGESLRSIVLDWRARVSTVAGGTWSQYGIKRLLVSGKIAGLRDHHGVPVAEGDWPAIIDRATHEQLRAVLLDAGRGTWSGVRKGHGPRRHVLIGLAVCGRCGTRLRAVPHARAGTIYSCPPSTAGGCGGVGAVAAAFEAAVASLLFAGLASDRFAAQLARLAVDDTQTQRLADQLQTDRSRLHRLRVDQLTDDVLERAAYLEAEAVLVERIRAAEAALATLESPWRTMVLPADVDGMRAEWDRQDVPWRHSLLRMHLERVVLLPALKRGANQFDVARIQMDWRA